MIELAAAANCSAVSLTDHDGLFGNDPAKVRADQIGIRFLPGCEVSCTSDAGPIHLLCYFLTDPHGELVALLERLRLDREIRNARLVERIVDLGIPLSYEEVRAEAQGPVVGRPHFAAALVRLRVVGSIDEAFGRYLKSGAPAYVARTPVDPAEVIATARASQAAVVLAHPLSLGLTPDDLEDHLSGLADAGLTGLEAHYGRYDPATRESLVGLSRRHGLVATGGSDFHGTFRPDLAVGTGTGDLEVPDSCLDELIARVL